MTRQNVVIRSASSKPTIRNRYKRERFGGGDTMLDNCRGSEEPRRCLTRPSQ